MPEQTNPSKNEGFLLKANGSRIQFAHCPIRACNGFPAWLPPQISGVFFWQNSRTGVQLRTGRVPSMRERFNTGSMESKEKQP
jgi:hypothetical protein